MHRICFVTYIFLNSFLCYTWLGLNPKLRINILKFDFLKFCMNMSLKKPKQQRYLYNKGLQMVRNIN